MTIYFVLEHLYVICGKGPVSFFWLQLSICPSTISWRDYSFLIEVFWLPFWNQLGTEVCFSLTLNSVLLTYMSILALVPHCLDSHCFVINFEFGIKVLLGSFLRIVLDILCPLQFHMNFIIRLELISMKKSEMEFWWEFVQ